ncbi:MAG: hypothetical protein ACO1SV_27675 [Fimbriimonas sp.]
MTRAILVVLALGVWGCGATPKQIEQRSYEETAARLSGEERARKEFQLKQMEEALARTDRVMQGLTPSSDNDVRRAAELYKENRTKALKEIEAMKAELAK